MQAKVLMFQGTASDVGKSLIAAAVCRIYTNRGYKVFPFKSQNMALNSYVTEEGFEMGRAQVVQAEAAKRSPDVRMNPILLKPRTDSTSQVIVKGKAEDNMSAVDYHKYKVSLRSVIEDVYKEIEKENDLIIIEGAGSPAEINLNDKDIVNMGMASIANSPVVLVADIDRGGVFASIYGTIALLTEEERKKVKGIVINKFRGDIKLLEPGIEMIEKMIGIPVVGVVPHLDLKIDSEDSLALTQLSADRDTTKDIDVAIIMLEKMSNFTDFENLSLQSDVSIRYVKTPQDLGHPDLVIIPSSKNSIEDVKKMEANGMKEALLGLVSKNVRFIGICEGYQLLGKKIIDIDPLCGKQRTVDGLGFLKCQTYLDKQQTTSKTKAEINELHLECYEIYTGHTELNEDSDFFARIYERNGKAVQSYDGAISKDEKIIGTYLYGLFNNLHWTRKYLNIIRQEKQLPPLSAPKLSISDLKEQEYEKLAIYVMSHLNMEKLDEIINDGL